MTKHTDDESEDTAKVLSHINQSEHRPDNGCFSRQFDEEKLAHKVRKRDRQSGTVRQWLPLCLAASAIDHTKLAFPQIVIVRHLKSLGIAE